MEINGKRLIKCLNALGETGKDSEGKRTRLAASDEDRAGRDLVAGLMREIGLKVVTDYIGNLFGIWETLEKLPGGAGQRTVKEIG